MLKGLLMRRQSSQVSGDAEPSSPEIMASPVLSSGSGSAGGRTPGEMATEPIYGDPNQDQGDEVRFYVELTKLDRLKDTFSIDIRRLKGNLRSYKFLYDCITECVLCTFSRLYRSLTLFFFVPGVLTLDGEERDLSWSRGQ